MIESWLPLIFLLVIVAGMVAARVWSAVISEGAPMLRDWVNGQRFPDPERRAGIGQPTDLDVDRRIEALEEQVQFLESLVRESPDDSHERSLSSR